MNIFRLIIILSLVINTCYSAQKVTLALPQTGWPTNANKVFALSANEFISAIIFRIYLGDRLIYSGYMEYRGEYWNLYQYTADISFIKTTGLYRLVVENYTEASFIISDYVFKRMKNKTGYVTIPDMINTFWHFQRCIPGKCFTSEWNFGGYYKHVNDSGLLLYEVTGTTKNLLTGTSKQLYGGWHDAVSTDKESPNIALSVMNMCHALEKITDTSDRNALLDELKWGISYLLKVQNDDGSFPACIWPCFTWENPVLPRHLEINKGTGIVARCAGALAVAATILKDIDSSLSTKSLNAAKSAWGWIEQNPDHFEFDNLPSWRTGSASTVLYAAVELARATGEQKYFNCADSTIAEGTFYKLGYWAKDTTKPGPKKFYGQLDYWNANMNEVSYGQAPVALARYYNITHNNAIKVRIENLCQDYVNKIKTSSNNPYLICESLFEFWWGFMPNSADLSKCLLHIGLELKNDEAIALAIKQYEWLVGFNPMGCSGIVGFGTKLVVPTDTCARSPENTIGGLLPGMILLNGELSTYYAQYNQWSICEVGESSAVIFDLLAGFNKFYNPLDSLSDLPNSITLFPKEPGPLLNIAPNPAKDMASISYKTDHGRKIELIVRSIDSISRKVFDSFEPEGQVSIDLSGLETGYYLIILRVDGQDRNHKSVIICR